MAGPALDAGDAPLVATMKARPPTAYVEPSPNGSAAFRSTFFQVVSAALWRNWTRNFTIGWRVALSVNELMSYFRIFAPDTLSGLFGVLYTSVAGTCLSTTLTKPFVAPWHTSQFELSACVPK